MKDTFQPGVSKTSRVTVDEGRTIGFMGDDLRVYATPELVRDIEMTARDLIVEHADDGEDSVGTQVNIAHLAATPLGNWVEVTVTVSEVNGAAVTFDVTASDALDQVCKGSHSRFVVNKEKLAGRLMQKKEKLAQS